MIYPIVLIPRGSYSEYTRADAPYQIKTSSKPEKAKTEILQNKTTYLYLSSLPKKIEIPLPEKLASREKVAVFIDNLFSNIYFPAKIDQTRKMLVIDTSNLGELKIPAGQKKSLTISFGLFENFKYDFCLIDDYFQAAKIDMQNSKQHFNVWVASPDHDYMGFKDGLLIGDKGILPYFEKRAYPVFTHDLAPNTKLALYRHVGNGICFYEVVVYFNNTKDSFEHFVKLQQDDRPLQEIYPILKNFNITDNCQTRNLNYYGHAYTSSYEQVKKWGENISKATQPILKGISMFCCLAAGRYKDSIAASPNNIMLSAPQAKLNLSPYLVSEHLEFMHDCVRHDLKTSDYLKRYNCSYTQNMNDLYWIINQREYRLSIESNGHIGLYGFSNIINAEPISGLSPEIASLNDLATYQKYSYDQSTKSLIILGAEPAYQEEQFLQSNFMLTPSLQKYLRNPATYSGKVAYPILSWAKDQVWNYDFKRTLVNNGYIDGWFLGLRHSVSYLTNKNANKNIFTN